MTRPGKIVKASSIDDLPKEQHVNKVYEYIKKHPNCRRSDLYCLDDNEGHIRTAVLKLLKGNRIRECLVAVD